VRNAGTVVVTALIVVGLAWLWPGRGMAERLRSLRAEVRGLEARLAAARQARAEAERLEAELRRLDAELAALRRRLPAEAEIRAVFEGVAFRARGAGLELESWRPREGAPPADAAAVPYRAWPVDVEAAGAYHALGRLAEALLDLERVVVLAGWRIEKVEEGRPPRLRARLRVETYTYVPPPKTPPKTPQAPAAPKPAADEKSVLE